MDKFKADLHIHSTLSTCGSLEMSPKKIFEKAKELNLNIISITDHNSISNSLPAYNLSKKYEIDYLFGMEVQTAEEIHVLVYFDNFNNLYDLWKIVYEKLPDIKNNPDIFGDQVIVDEDENIIGYEDKLLLNSSQISLGELFNLVKERDGIFIPAHIDRETFSIVSQIGFIPENIDVKYLEISYIKDKEEFLSDFPYYNKFEFVSFSDAHFLEDIGRSITIFTCVSKNETILKTIFNKENKISILRRFKC